MSNRNFKSSLKLNGYSPEEMYFYRLEQEAIAKLRKALGKEPLELSIGLKDEADPQKKEAQDHDQESENYQTYKKAA